jgi:hypothetical protein
MRGFITRKYKMEDGTEKVVRLIYDTDKAKYLANVTNYDDGWDAKLYQTPKGAWFMTRTSADDDEGHVERLFPFEEPEKLRDWLLENGQLALLEEFFPDWVKDNFEEA